MKATLVLAGLAACSCLAAAAIAPAAYQPQRPVPAVDEAALPVMPGRIALTRAEVREAVASGQLARPVATVLDIDRPLSHGDYRWDEAGVPPGELWIRIDLQRQLLSAFRGPHEIGTAVILYGADSHKTPVGTFPILAKARDHRSSSYDAAMPYTLRLTADGVSIHASNIRYGMATHGCIGVPEAFAARLFEAASPGDEVLITDSRKRTSA